MSKRKDIPPPAKQGIPNAGICDVDFLHGILQHSGCGGRFAAPAPDARKTRWQPTRLQGARFRCQSCGHTLGRKTTRLFLRPSPVAKPRAELRYSGARSVEIVDTQPAPRETYKKTLVGRMVDSRKKSRMSIRESADGTHLDLVDSVRGLSHALPSHMFSLGKLRSFREFVNEQCAHFGNAQMQQFLEQELKHLLKDTPEEVEPALWAPPDPLAVPEQTPPYRLVIRARGAEHVLSEGVETTLMGSDERYFLWRYAVYANWVIRDTDAFIAALRAENYRILTKKRAVSSSGRASGFHPEGGRFETGTALQMPSRCRCCGSDRGESLEGRCRDCGQYDPFRSQPNQTPEGWYHGELEGVDNEGQRNLFSHHFDFYFRNLHFAGTKAVPKSSPYD